ncbi:MAG: hypothetical protein LWY06_17575 [Firmicutes bacterium]|nr:hypothetical protein [Bacillota bacterium]
MLCLIAAGFLGCYLIYGPSGVIGFAGGTTAACLAFYVNTAFVGKLMRGEISHRFIVPLVFLKIAAAGVIMYCSLAAGGSALCAALGISSLIAAPVLNILSAGKSIAGS